MKKKIYTSTLHILLWKPLTQPLTQQNFCYSVDLTYVLWQTSCTTGPFSSGCTPTTDWLSSAALQGDLDQTSWSGQTQQTGAGTQTQKHKLALYNSWRNICVLRNEQQHGYLILLFTFPGRKNTLVNPNLKSLSFRPRALNKAYRVTNLHSVTRQLHTCGTNKWHTLISQAIGFIKNNSVCYLNPTGHFIFV